ncbi:MAG: crossover junction endodeoxyribonuclease RuvC [Alphaproteobacteria bacterium]|nr:crossover junction endodeoxyribonuclease RuvC [Alphaproteobacteria bacterium]MCZ6591714.1 crossover junction endodeoxyribonuclease RuvC [Alphaproteobacteria bacterium]MCZ6846859.1 crossover junction endodeoxyribonuclease RuvC [Alphaproteobacteria bacterium]
MLLLGLDPGLRNTGWGVIEAESNRLRHVANGVVRSGAGPLAERLLRLHQGLTRVIGEYRLDGAAVEETFMNRDGQATLKLGQARGIVMLVPAQAGLPVAEYAANTIKKSVVGYGHADKTQIGHMISVLLPGADVTTADAADALAVAVCHAHHMATSQRLEAAQ